MDELKQICKESGLVFPLAKLVKGEKHTREGTTDGPSKAQRVSMTRGSEI